MRDFIRHFVREQPGFWRCIEPTEVHLDGGRIQIAPGTLFTRGTSFMGVDVAALLDEEFEDTQESR